MNFNPFLLLYSNEFEECCDSLEDWQLGEMYLILSYIISSTNMRFYTFLFNSFTVDTETIK